MPSDSSKDYYYLLRDTPNNETLIVEYGFADSTGDDVSILKNNWEDIAEAVVRALATYLNVNYVAPAGSDYYTVKSGDTLWKIANLNKITVAELKEANNLKNNSLSIGQVLMIPKDNKIESGTYSAYIVKAGDSLYKIANANNTNVNELKNLNNLTSNLLQIGQVLKIPTGNKAPESNNIYTIVAGDSLYKIANRFNTTVSDIMAANNLKSSNLSIGQTLVIPSAMSNQVYTVVAGDSLYQIARRFNTSVKAIQDLNNLNSTLLSVGQKLLIP